MHYQVHIAVQYLAAAGISFLEKRQDDSHTNLAFDPENGMLVTRPLNEEGCKIAFDYLSFSLLWITDNTVQLTLSLDGKTHRDVLDWIDKVTNALCGTNHYSYNLHYELPYDPVTYDFTFNKPSQQALIGFLNHRRIAQYGIEYIVEKMELPSPVRVWPHHFDTGCYAILPPHGKIGVGFGMSIPDTIVGDFYLYVSGYADHKPIDTSSFEQLSFGTWMDGDFKGAVLPMSGINEAKAVTFFTEAIRKYQRI